jgi:hypothetical protein
MSKSNNTYTIEKSETPKTKSVPKSVAYKTVFYAILQVKFGSYTLIDDKLITEETAKLEDYCMNNFFSIVKKFKMPELFKVWGGNGHQFKYTVQFVSMMEFYNLNIMIVNKKGDLMYPLHYPFMVKGRTTVKLEKGPYGFSILY